MALWAYWNHGHSVNIENPDIFDEIRMLGFGARLVGKKGKSTWLHFPIPSPVIIGEKVFLDRLMIRGNTKGDAEIRTIRAWDGDRRIVNDEGVNLKGNFMRGFPFYIVHTFRPRYVFSYGIAISLLVYFGSDSNDREVLINSIGLDCYDSK